VTFQRNDFAQAFTSIATIERRRRLTTPIDLDLHRAGDVVVVVLVVAAAAAASSIYWFGYKAEIKVYVYDRARGWSESKLSEFGDTSLCAINKFCRSLRLLLPLPMLVSLKIQRRYNSLGKSVVCYRACVCVCLFIFERTRREKPTYITSHRNVCHSTLCVLFFSSNSRAAWQVGCLNLLWKSSFQV